VAKMHTVKPRSQWNYMPHARKSRPRISEGVLRALAESKLPPSREAYTQRLRELELLEKEGTND